MVIRDKKGDAKQTTAKIRAMLVAQGPQLSKADS